MEKGCSLSPFSMNGNVNPALAQDLLDQKNVANTRIYARLTSERGGMSFTAGCSIFTESWLFKQAGPFNLPARHVP